MNAVTANLPNYVLLDGKQRLGPRLLALPTGPEFVAIHGFSDKQPYDRFCTQCDLLLTPYPLVKGYLKNQIADAGETVLLVAIDATGPQDNELSAATMNAVLEAMEKKSDHVPLSFRLTLDPDAQAYHVEQASFESELASRPAETP